MTDSTPAPAPEEAPSAGTSPRAINWHRVRVYFWSIMLMVALWAGATLVTIRLHPGRMVDKLMSIQPFSYTIDKVYWQNRRTLVLENVKIGGFFYADSVTLVASPFGLWRHHLAEVRVLGGQVFTKQLYAAMDQVSSSRGEGIDWVIGRLEISRGTVLLNNLIEDTSIPVRLGVRHPLVLNALRLGKPDESPEMTVERSAEISNVAIVSPVDPVSPVFYFPLTRVRFTYDEFWHHHIRQIEVVRPTLFLGEDLFWLTKQFKAPQAGSTTPGPASPWFVGDLEVQFGQLAVNAFGQPVVHFPFFFGTQVKDIRLDQLDQISAKSTVPISNFSREYPDYKVRIEGLTGNLYFNWPPTDTKANNVSNILKVLEVSWNDIPVRNVEASLYFDPNGVYGKLTNGTCEHGWLNGNFEFYYTKGFTWNADLFCGKVNCQPIAEKLVGKYVNLTGELDGSIGVQGRSTEILKCTGELSLPNPGQLEIKSMDDLVNRIPADMIQVKKDALKLAIASFQTYPYQQGKLTINYTPAGGLSSLRLDGPKGSRQFDVVLHPYAPTDAVSTSH